MARLNRADALVLVHKLFERTHLPILIGPTSVVLGHTWNLEETESLFNELLSLGKIRHLTEQEKWRFDCFYGFLRVVNVARADFVETPGPPVALVSQVRAIEVEPDAEQQLASLAL